MGRLEFAIFALISAIAVVFLIFGDHGSMFDRWVAAVASLVNIVWAGGRIALQERDTFRKRMAEIREGSGR